MRVFKSKSLLLSLLLIVAVNFSLTAQDASKTYTETYDISKGVTVSADTKYSDIEILTWDRDVVDILVEVEVDASSDNGWSRNVKFEIDITIKAPKYINLTAEIAYGDLFLQEVSGLALLDLRYSNLKAGSLSRGNEKPYNMIDFAYSNGEVDEVGWAEVELSYSDLEINLSRMLFVESKYSKLLGEKFGGVVTEGAYDKYYIDEIDSFVAELKYSGLKFGVLNQTLNLQSSYTNAKIAKLSKNFDEVEATLSYGNIYLNVEEGASFKFEGAAKYGSVNIDTNDKLSKTKENSYVRVWGTVGGSAKSSMNLMTKYGNSTIE